MHLEKFVHEGNGRIIMSVLLGIGLATLFREACKGDNCVIKYAPPLEEIEDKIYKFDKKCFNIEKQSVLCDKTKNEIFNFQ
jgi:hypothetical protein